MRKEIPFMEIFMGMKAMMVTGTKKHGGAVLIFMVILFFFGGNLIANDYPTNARVEYVLSCMSVHGQTRQSLEECSCSIDAIASVIPYEKYVEVETIMTLGRVSGPKASIFSRTPGGKAVLDEFKRAQVEADEQCFISAN